MTLGTYELEASAGARSAPLLLCFRDAGGGAISRRTTMAAAGGLPFGHALLPPIARDRQRLSAFEDASGLYRSWTAAIGRTARTLLRKRNAPGHDRAKSAGARSRCRRRLPAGGQARPLWYAIDRPPGGRQRQQAHRSRLQRPTRRGAGGEEINLRCARFSMSEGP
jgi:hypothetical protein